MNQQVAEVLAAFDENPTVARTMATVRKLEALHEQTPGLFATKSLYIVRNYTLEPIEPMLKIAAFRAGMRLSVAYSGYEPQAADTMTELVALKPDVVFLAMRLEELSTALTIDLPHTAPEQIRDLADGAIDQISGLVRAMRAQSKASVLVSTFATPVHAPGGLAATQTPGGAINLVRRLNVELVSAIGQIDGAHILDIDHLFANLGLKATYDERGSRQSHAPLAPAALRPLADLLVRHIGALKGALAKVIVVDCDNTIWGGVIGDDGMEGIVLSGAFETLHRELRDLRSRGVVLAIASKNDEINVLTCLREHPDCLLKESDFAAHRINWIDKATNIKQMAEELNLGLDHFVFIDDNPVECEWVRSQLPTVRVYQYPQELGPDGTIESLGLFDSLVVTDEDRKRTELYQADRDRKVAATEALSPEDYLRSLKNVVLIDPPAPHQLARVAQLMQKTNQFNLTTRRHERGALESMLEDPNTQILCMELNDRFGSNGLIGVGIVKVEGEEAVIDTMLMSCRVLGRNVESVLVNQMAQFAAKRGAHNLRGEYIKTAKNGMVSDLYTRLGGAQQADGSWVWSLDDGAPSIPDWFEIVSSSNEVAKTEVAA